MKKTTFILFFCFLAIKSFAQEKVKPLTVSGKIESVTMYRQSAKMIGTASAEVKQGVQEIVIGRRGEREAKQDGEKPRSYHGKDYDRRNSRAQGPL